jgi:hypothetical protein
VSEIEEIFFVARNKMNGSRRLLAFPPYNLFFDARLGDTQETDPRTS